MLSAWVSRCNSDYISKRRSFAGVCNGNAQCCVWGGL